MPQRKENPMQTQYILLLLAFLALAAVMISADRKRRARKQRDFTRRLETVLQPKEEIKAICPSRGGNWILTNKRLIIENGEGFLAWPFSKIKSVSGVTAEGKKTTSAAKMTTVTVKTTQEYTLHNHGEEFVDLVKELKKKIAKKKKK